MLTLSPPSARSSLSVPLRPSPRTAVTASCAFQRPRSCARRRPPAPHRLSVPHHLIRRTSRSPSSSSRARARPTTESSATLLQAWALGLAPSFYAPVLLARVTVTLPIHLSRAPEHRSSQCSFSPPYFTSSNLPSLSLVACQTRGLPTVLMRAHARPHMLNSPRFSRPVTASFALNRDKAEWRGIFVASTSLLHTFAPPPPHPEHARAAWQAEGRPTPSCRWRC
jgi:hypothetical protein